MTNYKSIQFRLVIMVIIYILMMLTINASTKRKRSQSSTNKLTYWTHGQTEQVLVHIGYTYAEIRKIIMHYIGVIPYPRPLPLCPDQFYHAYEKEFTGATFSACNSFFAISCQTHLHVYSVKSGRRLRTLFNPSGYDLVQGGFLFASDASFLVSKGESCHYYHDADISCISVWYAKPSSRIQTLVGHAHPITHLSLSADNTVLASYDYNQIKVWHLPSGTCTRTFTIYGLKTMHVSPDHTLIYTVTYRNIITQWSFENGVEQLYSYIIPDAHLPDWRITVNDVSDTRITVRPGKDNHSFRYGTGKGDVYEHTIRTATTVRVFDNHGHFPVVWRRWNFPAIEFWKRPLMLGADFMVSHNQFVRQTNRQRHTDRIMRLSTFSTQTVQTFSYPKDCECWFNYQPQHRPWAIFYNREHQTFQIVDLKDYIQKNETK